MSHEGALPFLLFRVLNSKRHLTQALQTLPRTDHSSGTPDISCVRGSSVSAEGVEGCARGFKGREGDRKAKGSGEAARGSARVYASLKRRGQGKGDS